MNLHYWAGYITPEIIAQHKDIEVWAKEWLQRANLAQRAGNELIVFEMPKNELLYTVATVETVVQKIHPIPPPGVDPMLFDLSFYKALMEGK
jgi:hypothetical protein